MKKNKVYIEVTNTISLGFTSGIQRVTQRILQEIRAIPDLDLEFIPIYYCRISNTYLQLSERQKNKLYDIKAQSKWFRINRIIYDYFLCRFQNNKVNFEPNSILLELESNWNNFSDRKKLYQQIKKDNGQVIFFCHDIIPLTNPELIRETTTARFKKYFQTLLPYIDKIITSSNFNKTNLLNQSGLNLKPENISIVKLGADLNKIETQTQNKRPIKDQYLLIVGTLEIRKNHILVLNAFEELQSKNPDLNLVIIGKKGWKIESTFQKLSELLEKGLKIRHLTNVSDHELQLYYQNAYLTLVPSSTEGYGLPLVEALKFGCPVICSDIEVFREVGGVFPDYFQAGNVNDLVKRISEYIQDNDSYNKKKKETLEYKAHGWSDVAKELYHSILNTQNEFKS